MPGLGSSREASEILHNLGITTCVGLRSLLSPPKKVGLGAMLG